MLEDRGLDVDARAGRRLQLILDLVGAAHARRGYAEHECAAQDIRNIADAHFALHLGCHALPVVRSGGGWLVLWLRLRFFRWFVLAQIAQLQRQLDNTFGRIGEL